MISRELDNVDPSIIRSNLGRKRDIASSALERLARHLDSNAVPNYPQAIDSLSILQEELGFVESLIRTFQSRIPFDLH